MFDFFGRYVNVICCIVNYSTYEELWKWNMLFNSSLLLDALLTKICAEFQAGLRKRTASGYYRIAEVAFMLFNASLLLIMSRDTWAIF